MLLDLADLAHRLLENGALVRLDVEAVDVAEVGRDQLRQLLDVLALLLATLPLAPADGAKRRWRVEGGQRLETSQNFLFFPPPPSENNDKQEKGCRVAARGMWEKVCWLPKLLGLNKKVER